jgi:hypothetical protein
MQTKIDWAGVEIEHRAGIRSLRDIGAEFGVSEAAIRKRAVKEGWLRDLGERIKIKAQELVRKSEVREGVRKATAIEIIESVATQQAAVILNERADIVRLAGICDKLEVELETDAGELERRAKILKTLLDSRKILIELRRRNYNIADNSNGDADTKAIDSFATWVNGGKVLGNIIGVNHG